MREPSSVWDGVRDGVWGVMDSLRDGSLVADDVMLGVCRVIVGVWYVLD